MMDTVLTAMLSGGGISVAVVWLSKTWIAERLRQSIAHEYAQLLERHKIELEAKHAVGLERTRADLVQDRAIRALGEDHVREAARVAQAKRIEAIQVLWSAILRTTGAVPELVVFSDALTADELATTPQRPQASAMFPAVNQQTLAAIFQDSQCAGEARLMAGDYLYSLYDAYRIVLGRAVHLGIVGAKSGRIDVWYKDSSILALVGRIFGDAELETFRADNIPHYEWLRTKIEREFLKHAEKLISGTESAMSALVQARAIQEQARALERATPNSAHN